MRAVHTHGNRASVGGRSHRGEVVTELGGPFSWRENVSEEEERGSARNWSGWSLGEETGRKPEWNPPQHQPRPGRKPKGLPQEEGTLLALVQRASLVGREETGPRSSVRGRAMTHCPRGSVLATPPHPRPGLKGACAHLRREEFLCFVLIAHSRPPPAVRTED